MHGTAYARAKLDVTPNSMCKLIWSSAQSAIQGDTCGSMVMQRGRSGAARSGVLACGWVWCGLTNPGGGYCNELFDKRRYSLNKPKNVSVCVARIKQDTEGDGNVK